MNKFKISQSCHKDFTRQDSCHFYQYKKWVEKAFIEPSNIYMDRGRYFEYLVIGGGAVEEQNLTDLPRLKDGKKSAEQIRIETQADIAKQTIQRLGFNIIDVQKVVEDDDFRGVIDFIAVDKDGNKSIWDLKLTADLSSSFSNSQYKNLETADYTQQAIYAKKYYEIYGELLPTYLYIADYSTKMDVKIAEIVISPSIMSRIKSSIMETKHLIDMYIEDNSKITYNPSYSKCSVCPCRDICSQKTEELPIEKVYV